MDPFESFIIGLAAYGVVGLVAIAFAERFIPLIPSGAMLATIGAAAADGHWQPGVAVVATALGGSFGYVVCFLAIRAFGATRARRHLLSISRPQGRIEGWIASAETNRISLAFSLQLVPTARILAPAMAVLPGGRHTSLHLATMVGIAIWNALFIGVGYVAALTTEATNITGTVLSALLCLILVQLGVACLLRKLLARGQNSTQN